MYDTFLVHFCGWCKVESNFTLLHVDIPLSQYHLLKSLFFLLLNYLSTFVENELACNVRDYFWAFNSIPSTCVSIIMPVPYRIDYRSFVISLKPESMSHSTLFFFSKIVFVVHSPYPSLEAVENTSSQHGPRLTCLFSVLPQMPSHPSPLFGNVLHACPSYHRWRSTASTRSSWKPRAGWKTGAVREND